MSDVIAVVEGLDFVVSLAAGQVHPDDLDAARRTADTARARAGHLGATMVLALVGGTGSGKSSLLNALAGETVASTSALRPHTTEPLAWVPTSADPLLEKLLDRLGIDQRVANDRFEGLAVLDMTDIDSIEFEHRDLVQRLMPDVDIVVWVLDPVKYADPALHADFIVPLAGSSDRLIFVLNKVDQLDGSSLTEILENLGRLLADDGVEDPVVFAVAADPPAGDPLGIESLAVHLGARLDEKRILVGKIIDDARRAARAVAGAAGVAGRGSLDFEERWLPIREAIVSGVVVDGEAGAAEEALRLLEGFILRLSGDAGGGFGVRLRQTFTVELIESQLVAALAAADASSDRARELDDQLQKRFGAPLRALLWERASLSAVVAGLVVDAAMVGESIRRPS